MSVLSFKGTPYGIGHNARSRLCELALDCHHQHPAAASRCCLAGDAKVDPIAGSQPSRIATGGSSGSRPALSDGGPDDLGGWHFASRDDLVAEAVEAALAHGSKRAETVASQGGPEALATTIDAYLSPLHRDKPETGCAVAALPADIARSGQRARAAYTAQVRRYLDLFAGLAPAGDPDDPHLILAAMVGAIALARAVDDPGFSDEILERVARVLHRHVQGEYAPCAAGDTP